MTMQRTQLSLYSVLLLTLYITLTQAQPECRTFPNYETRAYTYTACTNVVQVVDLVTTRSYCQEQHSSDAIVFPNEMEYNFIIGQLNDSVSNTFKYFPGFYQRRDIEDKYSPETGEFYWITDADTQITNESATYWQPFSDLILRFDEQSLSNRQTRSFLLTLEGKWLPGVQLGNGGDSLITPEGGVICMREGVPDISNTTPAEVVMEEEFQFWIVIAVAAGVVVLGLILGLTIFCVHRRSKSKQELKFHKVPQAENHAPQHV